MAILAPRKDVIETFVAKELAEPNKKMINNSDAYRAVKGTFIPGKITHSKNEKVEEKCRKYLELMG